MICHCSPYSTRASNGISQWDTVRHSLQISHLWQRNVFHCIGLPTMEALHFGEGNEHPHRPPTLAVHADIREVTEWSPSEVVHISIAVSMIFSCAKYSEIRRPDSFKVLINFFSDTCHVKNPVKDIHTNAAGCSNQSTEPIVTRHIMDSIHGYSCSIDGTVDFLRGYIYSLLSNSCHWFCWILIGSCWTFDRE